jgi:hypothetical protein
MQGAPPDKLRATFDGVCARYPPVLHHFFLEVRGGGGVGVMWGWLAGLLLPRAAG